MCVFNAGSDKRQHYRTSLSLSSYTVCQFGDIFEHWTRELANIKLVGLANQCCDCCHFEHILYRGGLFNKSNLESFESGNSLANWNDKLESELQAFYIKSHYQDLNPGPSNSRAGHFRYFFTNKKWFFCTFYKVNNLFLHQSYLKSPLPVKLTW